MTRLLAAGGERALLTLVVVGLLVLAAVAMAWGWRRRGARQSALQAPAARPESYGAHPLLDPVEGTYVSTTTAGDWLDRVVAHGLGTRSDVRVHVDAAGVLFERTGAREVFVPAADVRAVRLDSGMAGKFVERDGLVVLTWADGDALLDTGVRPRRAADRELLVAALASLAVDPAAAGQGGDHA